MCLYYDILFEVSDFIKCFRCCMLCTIANMHDMDALHTIPSDTYTTSHYFLRCFLIKKCFAKLYVWTLQLKIIMQMWGSFLSFFFHFSHTTFHVEMCISRRSWCNFNVFAFGTVAYFSICVWFYNFFQFGKLFYASEVDDAGNKEKPSR